MRSNGLTAASYTPVADVEPHLADALLEDLRAEGVAAYAKPVESSSAGGFDRPEFRVGVKDRLWVDAAASDRARALIAGREPDAVDDSDDLRWAQIVAGFDRPLGVDLPPWPADEDLAGDDGPLLDERDRAAEADRDEGPPSLPWGTRLRPGRSDDDEFLESTSHRLDDRDDDDRFVPDPPPPLPKLPPHKLLAWAGLLGGPVLLLCAAVFSLLLPTWVTGLAIIGFVGGFVTLVATMGDRDDDGGPSGGAVV